MTQSSTKKKRSTKSGREYLKQAEHRPKRVDNELLHRVYETYFPDARVGRKIAGDISRYIQVLETNLMACAQYINSGFCVCSCAKCYGAAHISSYKCPKEEFVKSVNKGIPKHARTKNR